MQRGVVERRARTCAVSFRTRKNRLAVSFDCALYAEAKVKARVSRQHSNAGRGHDEESAYVFSSSGKRSASGSLL